MTYPKGTTMFALLVNEENRELLAERIPTDRPDKLVDLDIFINHSKDWYAVTGYTTRQGKVIDWTIFPANMFLDLFDYDLNKVRVEWSQITFDDRF